MTAYSSAVGLLELTPDKRFDALSDLVRAETDQMRKAGASLLLAPTPRLRAWGADILGQIATVSRRPARPIATRLLAALDSEKAVTVIASIVVALRHTEDKRGLVAALSLVGHPSSNVRGAVAFALSSFSHIRSTIPALIRLSADQDADTRNWATFGLATSGSNPRDLLAALVDRLEDQDVNTSVEALIGLLLRCDPGALDLLTVRLRQPSIRRWAAGLANEMGTSKKIHASNGVHRTDAR